jgi:hypothetical protein
VPVLLKIEKNNTHCYTWLRARWLECFSEFTSALVEKRKPKERVIRQSRKLKLRKLRR